MLGKFKMLRNFKKKKVRTQTAPTANEVLDAFLIFEGKGFSLTLGRSCAVVIALIVLAHTDFSKIPSLDAGKLLTAGLGALRVIRKIWRA